MLDYNIADRERITLHCLITLLSPLSHIGEMTGNVSNLKTLKLLDIEGNPRSCFVYSGNALRNGILRRRGIMAALTELGLQVNPDVHHTLFAGGRIDGKTGNDMKLDSQIRQLMPWLSVLGTAKPAGVFGVKDAQMVPGRANIGSAYLICYESAGYIFESLPGLLPTEVIPGLTAIVQAKKAISADPFTPSSVDEISAYNQAKADHIPYLRKQLRSWTEYLVIDQTTRRDSTQDATLMPFLIGNQQALPEDQMSLLTEQKSETKSVKKSDQMIASDRLIMAGAKLYSRWDLHTTKVETGWVVDALLRFAESPYLGGKGNRGNGLCRLDLWYQCGTEQGKFLELSTEKQTLGDRAKDAHQKYRGYVEAYQEFLSQSRADDSVRGFLGA